MRYASYKGLQERVYRHHFHVVVILKNIVAYTPGFVPQLISVFAVNATAHIPDHVGEKSLSFSIILATLCNEIQVRQYALFHFCCSLVCERYGQNVAIQKVTVTVHKQCYVS